ncbi:unnamed protein product [Tilletia caries]|uniref:Uncharacterized protein n=1 Tax=Tilletia caries TaxID=13290 RepID=A0ABN7IX51_9BASI|nr:unnamed protein product [Tilletia caries]
MIASRTSSDHADARPCSESQPQAEGITNAPPSDPTTTQDPDVEAAGSMPAGSLAPAPIPAAAPAPALDIEHQLVDHDLQLWSSHQKAICVATLMLGALSPTLGASISLPALQSTQVQLNAFNATISLAVSLWHRSPFLALHIRAHRKEVDIHCGIDHLRGNLSHLRSFELGRSIRDHALHFSHRLQPHAQQEASTKSASAHNSESTPANSTIIPAFLASSPHTMPLLDNIITLLWCLAESSSESMLSQLDGFDTEVTSGKPTLTPGSHRPCRPKGQEQSEFNNFTYVGRLLHRISFVSLCRLCK